MKSVDPLHGIAAFLAVAEAENFTAAAEAIGLSRATISAQVADLEKRLGVRLFHRTTRVVRLTPAGRAYREHLADLGARVARAERAAQAEHGAPEGRLRLTAPPDFSQRFLVPWIAEFLTDHPGVRIALEMSNEARNLVEGRFDLAIRATLEIGPSLVTREIGASPMLTCAAPRYLKARGWPQRPEDLSAHDLLHFSPLRRGHVWAMRCGDEQVEVPVVPRLELDEGLALVHAAVLGAGICQLPAAVVGAELAAGRLLRVLGDWSAGVMPLHAVYPDNRLIALRVKAFVAFLARKARAEPDLQRGAYAAD